MAKVATKEDTGANEAPVSAKPKKISESFKATAVKAKNSRMDKEKTYPPKWRLFQGMDLSGKVLTDLFPDTRTFNNCDFSNCNLDGTIFNGRARSGEELPVQGCKFRGANVTETTSFAGCDLRWSDFDGCEGAASGDWGSVEDGTLANRRECGGLPSTEE